MRSKFFRWLFSVELSYLFQMVMDYGKDRFHQGLEMGRAEAQGKAWAMYCEQGDGAIRKHSVAVDGGSADTEGFQVAKEKACESYGKLLEWFRG